METDIYQTPEAILSREEDGEAEFYVVSRGKFLILYAVTLGMYGVYWFYKNWRQYGAAHSMRIWPLARAIFSIFFAHSLFRFIYRRVIEVDEDRRWQPNLYATIYVVFDVIVSFFDGSRWLGISETMALTLDLILVFVIGWVLYNAQILANIACADVAGKSNSRLTLANYFWILLCVLIWVLILFGVMLDTEVIDIGEVFQLGVDEY